MLFFLDLVRAGNDAVRLLASKEGLICDTVYTGKALSRLLDYASFCLKKFRVLRVVL